MSHPFVFRPRGGIALAAAAILVCVAALVYIAVADGPARLLQWAWPIVTVAWLSWLLYIRPSVTVTEGFVEIDNVWRVHRVPWGDVDDVSSRFALTVRTRGAARIRAWAAPAPGARRALATRREEVSRTPGEGETRRVSDAEGTDSGDAATLVRRAVEAHERSGVETTGTTVTRWHGWLIAVTAALITASVWTLAQAAAHG